MPQGDRNAEQEKAFGRMLSNINLLFLGASVFILCDMSCTRFCSCQQTLTLTLILSPTH